MSELKKILEAYKEGSLELEAAVSKLRNGLFENIGHSRVDHDRMDRNGKAEVIFGEGKSVQQMADIMTSLKKHGQDILITRLSPEKADALLQRQPEAVYHETARLLTLRQTPVTKTDSWIAVACAGTSDFPVAEEARLTAEFYGNTVKPIYDAGVAGLHRLLADLETLREALHGIWLLRELTPRSLDYVVSFGELMSSKIVAECMSAAGLEARAWPAWEAGMLTDDHYGEAAVQPESYPALKKQLGPELGRRVPVVTGFLARNRTGERTTLGRGGSDYTAAIIGAALDAEEIQIWTDVTGIMSCDPRIVADAATLRSLTFAEAAELAYFGAKVLHPRTVEPAVERDIPVRILNTFEADDPGTLVVNEPEPGERRVVQGLAVKRSNLLVSITSTRMLDAEGYLARVFDTLARHDVSVDLLATSEVSVSLTAEARYADGVRAAMKDLRGYARTTVATGHAVIAVVGAGMSARPGIAGEVFGTLGAEGVNIEMISQGASELNMSFVVRDADADRALRALHGHFMRPGAPTVTVAAPRRAARKAPVRKRPARRR